MEVLLFCQESDKKWQFSNLRKFNESLKILLEIHWVFLLVLFKEFFREIYSKVKRLKWMSFRIKNLIDSINFKSTISIFFFFTFLKGFSFLDVLRRFREFWLLILKLQQDALKQSKETQTYKNCKFQLFIFCHNKNRNSNFSSKT